MSDQDTHYTYGQPYHRSLTVTRSGGAYGETFDHFTGENLMPIVGDNGSLTIRDSGHTIAVYPDKGWMRALPDTRD